MDRHPYVARNQAIPGHVQGEIRDDSPQSLVLTLQVFQALGLGSIEAAVLLAPAAIAHLAKLDRFQEVRSGDEDVVAELLKQTAHPGRVGTSFEDHAQFRCLRSGAQGPSSRTQTWI